MFDKKKRHIQTQARQDKAWQGMTRPGEARPDEARRGGARREGVPWFWKILYMIHRADIAALILKIIIQRMTDPLSYTHQA